MSDTKSLQAAIDEETENHEKKLKLLVSNKTLFQRVLNRMPQGSVNNLYPDTTDLNIIASGSKPILAGCIRALRTVGFKPNSKPVAGATGYHDHFSHPDGAAIWFSFTSTACRRVKVGSQLVEQDIYETFCDEHEQAID